MWTNQAASQSGWRCSPNNQIYLCDCAVVQYGQARDFNFTCLKICTEKDEEICQQIVLVISKLDDFLSIYALYWYLYLIKILPIILFLMSFKKHLQHFLLYMFMKMIVKLNSKPGEQKKTSFSSSDQFSGLIMMY